MTDLLTDLAREVFLLSDADQYALRERAAIRWESGEDDATAQAAAIADVRAAVAARPARPERDAASWRVVAEWRREHDDGRRRERAELVAWERAQWLGRRG